MIDTTNMSIMANLVQPSSNMSSHMISQKDSDSDKSLSINEMGISEDFFTSIDSDSSGLINQSELTSAIDSKMSDFNGQMPSQSEFQSMLSDFGFEVPSSTDSASNASTVSETISSILEDYDADNLTQSDAQEIIAALKDAGIEPGEELESAMEEAGFDAHEIGTLGGAGGPPPPPGGGGQASSSESEEEYDSMDTNEDGVVSLEEMQEYYGSSSTDTIEELSSSDQNAMSNLKLLMDALKTDSDTDSVDTESFTGLLKTINSQNNNSDINTYLKSNSSASMFGYA